MEFKQSWRWIVLGEPASGKSSFLVRLLRNEFDSKQKAALGSDSVERVITLNDQKLQIQYFDAPKLKTLRVIPQKPMGFLVVFDLTNKRSWTRVSNWIMDIETIYGVGAAAIMVVGTKKDLNRLIKLEEIKEYCKERNVEYAEISAQSDDQQHLLQVVENAFAISMDKKLKELKSLEEAAMASLAQSVATGPAAPEAPAAPAAPEAPEAPAAPAAPGAPGAGVPAPPVFDDGIIIREVNMKIEKKVREVKVVEAPKIEYPPNIIKEFETAFLSTAKISQAQLVDVFRKLKLINASGLLQTLIKEEKMKSEMTMSEYLKFLHSKRIQDALEGRQETEKWIQEHLTIPSRLRILPLDGDLSMLLPYLKDPATTVIGFDFDQTISLVKVVNGKKTFELRGGEKTKQAIASLYDKKIPMCIITAQIPTPKMLRNVRQEILHLGVGDYFGMTRLDIEPLERMLLSWGSNETMELHLLTQKLLALLVINSPRFAIDVGRISFSGVQFRYTGHPASWEAKRINPAQYNAAHVHPAAIPESKEETSLLERCVKAYYRLARNDEMDITQRIGWSSNLVLTANKFKQKNDPDVNFNPSKSDVIVKINEEHPELCPVRCLWIYMQRTASLRKVLSAEDVSEEAWYSPTSLNRLILNPNKPGVPYLEEELEHVLRDTLRAATIAERGEDIVHDYAFLVPTSPVPLGSYGQLLASRYNKPEALEYFLESKKLQPKNIIFVDDNADNAYNVFTHFAKKQLDDPTQPSIHAFWFQPPKAENQNEYIVEMIHMLSSAYPDQ